MILEEGNLPHQQCPLCDMLVLWRSLNDMHWCTAQCRKGAERKQRRLSAEEERAVTSRAFILYGRPIEKVTSLQYLRRVILAADNGWPAVVRNLSRVRLVCKRMTIILSREGVDPRVSGFFFKVVVQAVLIFGSETWVSTHRMVRVLGGGSRTRWRNG